MKFTCPGCKQEFAAKRPSGGEPLRCPDCGHEFTDPDPTVMDDLGPLAAGGVAPGKELGGFQIEEKIGTGAMGEVYRATQLSLNRTVALKVLPRAFADRPAFVRRFHEESQALSTLNHPNIVTIIERGNVGKIYFFVMEYVDGPSLQQLMSRPFTVQEFVRIARGTAAALDYAHNHGVVHRDVKPSNIMMTEEVGVKIADFGLAGLMEQERKAAEGGAPRARRMGTPAYMSPEQRRNPMEVDGRADIYAAGVVFYELLTQERPEVPLSRPPSEVSRTADPRLDPIVTRCLEQDPDDRYQSAEELLEDLDRFESELKRAPACPSCGKVSPVRFHKCMYCDASLEQFFDICPDCRQRNRHDVRRCINCGVDLERGRTLVSNKVSMMLDQADRLRLNARFGEALELLEEVKTVEGKSFAEERKRAETLRHKVLEERRAAARRNYAEAMRMVRTHRFKEAIEMFRQVPPDIKDTTEAIKATMERQARIAAERRSESVTNLVLFAIGLIMLIFFLIVVL